MMEFIITVLVVLALFGWVFNLLEWLGITTHREVANRFAVCPECLVVIKPGTRTARNSRGQPCHLRCR